MSGKQVRGAYTCQTGQVRTSTWNVCLSIALPIQARQEPARGSAWWLPHARHRCQKEVEPGLGNVPEVLGVGFPYWQD